MSREFEQAAPAFGAKGALFGLDIGEKTIGVAVCDPSRMVATPVGTIRRKKFTADAEKLAALAAERNIAGIVIGLPLNMDGSEGPSAQRARAFARNLPRILDLPVAFWDERLSTAAMERDLIAIDTSRAKRAEKIDEMAATFILQGAIDRLRSLTSGASGSSQAQE
ncbi:Holliday junction resolvase RuvX [Hyphococcus sp.]|jgi:putative Holliday junction resolvase|uniref:Holliday junction resolvase RuvX n=1 Tax=Hyphococcus sp. TaxID=2038636 RepID=UPI003D1105FA